MMEHRDTNSSNQVQEHGGSASQSEQVVIPIHKVIFFCFFSALQFCLLEFGLALLSYFVSWMEMIH